MKSYEDIVEQYNLDAMREVLNDQCGTGKAMPLAATQAIRHLIEQLYARQKWGLDLHPLASLDKSMTTKQLAEDIDARTTMINNAQKGRAEYPPSWHTCYHCDRKLICVGCTLREE